MLIYIFPYHLRVNGYTCLMKQIHPEKIPSGYYLLETFVRACRNSIHLFVLSTSNQQRSIIEIVISLNFVGLLGQERNQ